MDQIEVVDVALSPPQLGDPDIEFGARTAWTELAITVHNPAERTTLFVRADHPALRYEAATGVLTVLLAELPTSDDLHLSILRQPALQPVLPGTSAVIRTRIPTELRLLDLDTPGPPRLETIDITGVQQIEVTISFDSTPFRPVHTDSAPVIRAQLHAWGRRTTSTHACCLPPPEAEAASSD